MVIGDPEADATDQNGQVLEDAGQAYWFRRGSTGWVYRGVMRSDDRKAGDRFGASVAVDGHLIVVGVPGQDFPCSISIWDADGDYEDSYNGIASDAGTTLLYGLSADKASLRLFDDADPRNLCSNDVPAGRLWGARDFAREGESVAVARWTENQYLVLTGAPGFAYDGGHAFVSAFAVNADGTGNRIGIQNDYWGYPWSDGSRQLENGQFSDPGLERGNSVSITKRPCLQPCADQFIVAIGAPGVPGGDNDVGRVDLHMLQINQGSEGPYINAVNVATLAASGADFGQRFGQALALNGGRVATLQQPGSPARLLVGAPGAKTLDVTRGAVSVFEETTSGIWNLTGTIAGPQPFAGFGTTLALDNRYGWAGVPAFDAPHPLGGTIADAGAVYRLAPNASGVWGLAEQLAAPSLTGDAMGRSVATDGGAYVVAGAPGTNGGVGGARTWVRNVVLTTEVLGAGFGSVHSAQPGIQCPTDCSGTYPGGSTVRLVANPASDSFFAGWSGDACVPVINTGGISCDVAMHADRNVRATFRPRSTVYLGISGPGQVQLVGEPAPSRVCNDDCQEDFYRGTELTLKALSSGTFLGWGGACEHAATAMTCTITLATTDVSVTAAFTDAPSYRDLTVTVSGEGAGSVSSSPAGIACPGECSYTFLSNQTVTLTATPYVIVDPNTNQVDEGASSAFYRWTGDCTDSEPTCVVPMTSERDVNAEFRPMLIFRDSFE